MGLFLAPFSGHAVGGGGHGVIDPPPPGVEPNIDVDTVNRSPLRLLRTTMNKHTPKFMKVVPPGQQRGSLAPPYTWNTLERDDWSYEQPKRRFSESDEDILGPKDPPKRPRVDPRAARIDAIQGQLVRLRAEVKQLLARRHALVQAGKASLQKPQAVGVESLVRMRLLLLTEAETPHGIWGTRPTVGDARRSRFAHRDPALEKPGMQWLARLERRRAQKDPEPYGLSRTPIRSISSKRRQERKRQLGRELAARGLAPPRPQTPAPAQSAEIISITKQLKQKHYEISNLVNELKQLRMQRKQAHESSGLSSNNRRRLSLLLK
jgi:hypothetical protein